MENGKLRKGLNVPTLHVGADLRVPVLASILEHGVTFNRFVTVPPYELRGVRDRFNAIAGTTLELSSATFIDEPGKYSQPRKLLKMPDQVGKVCRANRDVSVEVANEFILNIAQITDGISQSKHF